MLQEFKKFILRGNVVDLAVGVVVGVAFTAVVTSLVGDIITPLIGAIGGQPDFANLSITVNDSVIAYGRFINAIVSFLIIAIAIFFLVIIPLNRLQERIAKRKTPEDPSEKVCTECLSEVPKDAKRCKYCTTTLK